MKLIVCVATTFVSIVPCSSVSSQTAVRATTDNLPSVFDASVPRERQIQLASSAAPPDVARHATVYVLTNQGYEKARAGSNGFSCLVVRSFVKPTETTVEPMCFDAEGSRTLLPVRLQVEELRAEGKSDASIQAYIAKAYKDGHFKAPSRVGILYMLSSENRLVPASGGDPTHIPPHLMFYAPYMQPKDFGYDSPSAVPLLIEAGQPDAMLVVMMPGGSM
ncbi:MAG TPA: hypothetical protein VJR24_00025 [Gemmatimonadaceae bacterium]|nr:hypothetical protein [Gemmatimonadaceae bacterium]